MNCKAILVSCPHCGKEHEHKYEYKGSPILACPEIKDDTIYAYKANWFGGIFNPKFNNYDMKPLKGLSDEE